MQEMFAKQLVSDDVIAQLIFKNLAKPALKKDIKALLKMSDHQKDFNDQKGYQKFS